MFKPFQNSQEVSGCNNLDLEQFFNFSALRQQPLVVGEEVPTAVFGALDDMKGVSVMLPRPRISLQNVSRTMMKLLFTFRELDLDGIRQALRTSFYIGWRVGVIDLVFHRIGKMEYHSTVERTIEDFINNGVLWVALAVQHRDINKRVEISRVNPAHDVLSVLLS